MAGVGSRVRLRCSNEMEVHLVSDAVTETRLMPAVGPDVTAVHEPVESSAPEGGGHNPLGDVRVEKPRTHPMTYLALIVGVIALLVAFAALGRHDGPKYRQVKIGAHECVIGHTNGVDQLYCLTNNLP